MSFDEFEEMNRMFGESWGILTKGRPLMSVVLERAIEKYRGYRTVLVSETAKEIIAKVEVPGLDKDDIVISLTEDTLEISVDIKHEDEKTEKEKKYIYKERYSGHYHQSIYLPGQVDPDKAIASYDNGILEIRMPRKILRKITRLKIE